MCELEGNSFAGIWFYNSTLCALVFSFIQCNLHLVFILEECVIIHLKHFVMGLTLRNDCDFFHLSLYHLY